MRLAIVIERIGPYHRARLGALGEIPGITVLAVEVFRTDRTYAWARVDDVPNVHRVTLFEHQAAVANVGSLRFAMDRALDEFGPMAVAVPGWGFVAGLVALAWCRRKRCRAILMSDSNAHDEPRKAWREAVKRFVVGCADAGFVAGTPQRRYLASLGMPDERITTGYDVVDNAHFGPGADAARAQADAVRSELGLPATYLLFVGRFVEKKNLDTLVEAYARFRHDTPHSRLHLVLVGDGPRRDALDARIRDLRVERVVHLKPFADYGKLPSYYGLARALILPSSTEQWGLVVNEAMATGIPILASDRCGCVDDLVVDGVTGHRFDPTDVDELKRLLLRATNAEEMAQLGSAAREHIASWTPTTFASALLRAVELADGQRCRRSRLFCALGLFTLARLQQAVVSNRLM